MGAIRKGGHGKRCSMESGTWLQAEPGHSLRGRTRRGLRAKGDTIMAFHQAVKCGALLRLALSGPAGAGKTYTALTLATALADGGTVALIDTEHGSASKYADIFPEFDTLQLETFHPQRYIDAIHEAEQGGYAVLVIDSLSHAWSGQGGLLEEKDKIARAKYSGNSFSAWNDASAIQNKLVNVILGAKLHIIATVRSKMDYVLETGANGKTMPRKVGMAPVQRDDRKAERSSGRDAQGMALGRSASCATTSRGRHLCYRAATGLYSQAVRVP